MRGSLSIEASPAAPPSHPPQRVVCHLQRRCTTRPNPMCGMYMRSTSGPGKKGGRKNLGLDSRQIHWLRYAHTHTHALSHTHAHAHLHAHRHARTHARKQTPTHTRNHASTHTSTHTHAHTRKHAHSHAHAHTRRHTRAHIHTHTDTYTQTQTLSHPHGSHLVSASNSVSARYAATCSAFFFPTTSPDHGKLRASPLPTGLIRILARNFCSATCSCVTKKKYMYVILIARVADALLLF